MLGRYLDMGSPVADHPLNAGLAAWWLGLPHNSGGSTLFDLCGKYHGTLTNSPSWDGPTLGGSYPKTLALTQTGNSRIATSAVSATGVFTLSSWVRLTAYNTGTGLYNAHLWFGTSGSNYGGLALGPTAANLQAFGSGAGEPSGATIATWPGLSQWVHLTWTRNASNWAVYLNGVSAGSLTSGTWGGANAQLQIGGRADASQSIDGSVWDIKFLDGVSRDAASVWNLYNQSLRGHPDTLNRYSWRVSVLGGYVAGGSFADATGSSSLTFAASATGSSLVSAAGSSSVAFTPTAAGSALADATGTATLAFTVSATGSALADATGAAALTFTASAAGSSLADAAGTATLTFTASATSGGFEDATGSTTLTFTASATGSALVSASGSSTLTFSASAAGAPIVSATGTATVTFTCSAVGSDGTVAVTLPPGGVIRRADTRRVIRPVAPPGRVVRRADVRRTFPD